MLRKHRKIRSWLTFAVALLWSCSLQAQEVALKTNLLYDGLTTPNLGLEVGLGCRMTAQLFYGLNPWVYSGSHSEARKVKHWVLMPELRWWGCTRMNGWFVGVHLMGGQFNAARVDLPLPGAFFSGLDVAKAVRDTRVEGSFAGAGLAVGYQWILSRHWNLEVETGVGYNRVWYDQFPCAECGTKLDSGTSNYAGLTKLGVTLMYVF
ncbi:MAG: DUF3575 domain-containing protein [Bacteroidales bacterium]|nr:DUF3575 domain-containing protein [Candidatus Physcousia equi]